MEICGFFHYLPGWVAAVLLEPPLRNATFTSPRWRLQVTTVGVPFRNFRLRSFAPAAWPGGAFVGGGADDPGNPGIPSGGFRATRAPIRPGHRPSCGRRD